MIQITRDQLREAIEAGIAGAYAPTAEQAAALRAVAERADMVAVGTFRCGSVGCPLVQAGLGRPPRRLYGFTRRFDDTVDRFAGWQYHELAEII